MPHFLTWLRRPKSTRRATRRRLSIEQLEDRTLPATVTWINPGSGNWDTGSNWSTGSVPGSGDDVVIDTSAAATITVRVGDSESVHQLTLGSVDTLSVTGGC